MKKFARSFLLAASLMLGAVAAQAAGSGAPSAPVYAVVDSVQMPAWIERNGVRQALEPGKVLQNRDHIITGADARVLIQLAEGSAVKLGENAQLDVNALGQRDNRVFTAALDVARGAFRFTTGVFSARQKQRAINVRIATITAGIRGTDLWGSADAVRDLICLIEGQISVFHPLDETRQISQPLAIYQAASGEAPALTGVADAQQLALWAAQTEIEPGAAYVRRGGKWKVELSTEESPAAALALYDRARAAGFAVRIKPLPVAGGYHYAIRVTQLPSRVEAELLASKLAGALDLASPSVTRY
jgi:hypothetical protein